MLVMRMALYAFSQVTFIKDSVPVALRSLLTYATNMGCTIHTLNPSCHTGNKSVSGVGGGNCGSRPCVACGGQ